VYRFRNAKLKVVAHRDRLSPSSGDHGLAIVTVRSQALPVVWVWREDR
jgi:hypothetical protein